MSSLAKLMERLPESRQDDILIDLMTEAHIAMYHISPEEVNASTELSERISGLALATKRSTTELHALAEEVAEKHGFECGLALPSISDDHMYEPVLALNAPLGRTAQLQIRQTWLEERLSNLGIYSRNSWNRLGDRTVVILNTTEGPMGYWEYHGGDRMRKLLAGMAARMDSAITADAEMRAMESLKGRITAGQWRCYLLNSCFPEHSKQSDLHYIFRKGYPTLAMSWHDAPNGRVLACLCFHPFGYFRDTHAGVMCPTDEVIAALVTMRSDEHRFWKKSGQWRAGDPRSGL